MNVKKDDNDQELGSKSLEELLLQSDLFAGMARADGKILDIEKSVSSTYFDQADSAKSELVKSHYDYVVQDDDTDNRLSTVMSFMSNLSIDDKYKLLRCLSAVAICDGELDPRELDILKQFAKAMDIDPSNI
jgi:uncharacterized tellurite resistance protein B-like protein